MGTSVRTLADGRISVVALDAAHKAADPKNPTVDELNAGQRLEMYVMKSDYKLGSKGSTSVEEPVLGAQARLGQDPPVGGEDPRLLVLRRQRPVRRLRRQQGVGAALPDRPRVRHLRA
nr:MAG TPA: hypothetical protein [Caudoviricetes sp.]